uniref:Putative adventurous gliding motility protein n=1 Tax=Janthinobacterium lividum TaxID=29581 RepID=A0SZ53_9BURK|nr:putative adventurous gliding motility protein [Janthinobacterium lividum]
MVGGQLLPPYTSRIDDSILQTVSDLSELDRLPRLMRLATRHGTRELMEYVARHPFLHELSWQSSTVSELDFSQSNLARLNVHLAGVTCLKLNKVLHSLALHGAPSPGLRMVDGYEGQFLALECEQGVPPFSGLDRVADLSLVGVRELDLAAVAQRFPGLQHLRIWGKPGRVTHLSAIAQLKQLRTFTADNLFGYGADDIPSAAQLPALSTLSMSSLPDDAAKAIKANFKQAAAQGLELRISKPRKPEWLAENLLNPFRDWDGRANISPTQAKKAAQAYKQLLAGTRAIDAAMDAASLVAVLDAMIEDYVGVFNQLDRRVGVIETVEREEIGTALASLLQQLVRHLGDRGVVLVDEAALLQRFDALREF